MSTRITDKTLIQRDGSGSLSLLGRGRGVRVGRETDRGSVRAIVCFAPDPHPNPLPKREREQRRAGFTLVEALASLMLVAVVLPFVIRGVSMSARNAAESDRRADAVMLAQTMLEQAVLAGAWQSGDTEGDFDESYGRDAMRYTWALTVADWQSTDYRELTMTVRWTRGNKGRSVSLSTVVNADE